MSKERFAQETVHLYSDRQGSGVIWRARETGPLLRVIYGRFELRPCSQLLNSHATNSLIMEIASCEKLSSRWSGLGLALYTNECLVHSFSIWMD